MSRFHFEPMPIPEVIRVRSETFRDERGTFAESFRMGDFARAGIEGPFVQDNLARSRRGVLRGLHFQLAPSAQGKLVTPVEGAIFDVAVDLRRESPSFGQWVGVELDAASGESLWIPAGFAHGYQTLSEGATVLYKVTALYDPHQERGIRWNDPELAIPWPMADPILSPKDRLLPELVRAELP